MRTKNIYLCLLLLVLGVANVWADKYYEPYNYLVEDPRFANIADMVGKKFMIYNTALNGEQDRTGFLYDNGTTFGLDKSKERDRFVYNEKYVYTLESFTDANGVYYAIKSVTSGLYVSIDGTTVNATPQPLYITKWSDAKTYNTSNANGEPDWGLSGVDSESANFSRTANGSISGEFIIASTATPTNTTKYWNGTEVAFDKWSDGHPYAFYQVREVTSGDYLTDLHIFSRCDIYSAQVIWGYVQLSANITTSDATENQLLIDGDATTGINTTGNYVQFNLGKSVTGAYVYLQRSGESGVTIPANVNIQVSATGADGTWVTIDGNTSDVNDTSFATGLGSALSYTKKVEFGGSYQHIRVVNATTNATSLALSEAYVLPNDTKVEQSVGYFDALKNTSARIYNRATVAQYEEEVAQYNSKYPEVKTLSGVPIAGNKYRIYADAYDVATDKYVNKEIYLGDGVISPADAGSYHSTAAGSADRKKYEWYCEETPNGTLVFRNVYAAGDDVPGDIYLCNNGVVSSTAYEWNFSTVQTFHFGVPLWGNDGKYLAVNNGTDWVNDVTAAQNQTVAPYTVTTTTTTTDPGTGEETTTTTTTTVSATGACTDFVFIPVPLDEGVEKKITFTANDIVKRNVTFTLNGTKYSLPFSKTFVSSDAMPQITLNSKDIHSFKAVVDAEGTDVTGTKASHTDGVVSFTFANIEDADVLELQLTIGPPFEMGNSYLYLIMNKRPESVAQQAPSMPRRSATDVPVSGGTQASTSSANVYYARYDGENVPLGLDMWSENVAHSQFNATSLFYFTPTENTSVEEYYNVNICSAITSKKCYTPDSWTSTGRSWYIQPNTKGKYNGYVIGRYELNDTNNPYDAWCTNHTDGNKVLSYYANDNGSSWEFVYVEPADAAVMLKKYAVADADGDETFDDGDGLAYKVKGQLEALEGEEDVDEEKLAKYKALLEDVIDKITNVDAATATAEVIATLVPLVQQVYMLESEVQYALLPLPEVTDRDALDKNEFAYPKWYYIYNVRSKELSGNDEEYYAKFRAHTIHMALEQVPDGDSDGDKDFNLPHLFYFEGTRNSDGTITDGVLDANSYNQTLTDNALTFDEFLEVDIHNFTASKGYTLVSKDVTVFSGKDIDPGNGKAEGKVIANGFALQNDSTWRIECEYDFSNGFHSYNTYGSCLLTSFENPGANEYTNHFQVYMKADASIVVKMNNGNNDRYRFTHTMENHSKIKIVITHSPVETKFTVYNSEGDDESIVVENPKLTTITELRSMFDSGTCSINILGIEKIRSYWWEKEDDTTQPVSAQKDTWYVLPSSNTKYPGLAIVANSANDNNLGWTNAAAKNDSVFSDAGYVDNSTWQYVKVTRFDDHADQLLALYNIDDCVIYNEKLAALQRLIKRNVSFIKGLPTDEMDEYYFNEMYAAICAYDGPMPEEFRAPKLGKFYTIRPVYGNSNDNLMANAYNCITQQDSLLLGGEYDSRAVWYFDGTTESGNNFYDLAKNLSLISLHTQSNTGVIADTVRLKDKDDARENVEIEKLGACIVRLSDGTNYLRHTAVGDSAMTGAATPMDYGYLTTTFNRTGTQMDGSTTTTTTVNECNELLYVVKDGAVKEANVSVTSNYNFRATKEKITSSILCPDVNGGSESNTSATTATPIELVFTYTNLPASFTSFNNVALDIHALNGANNYQMNNDGYTRQWNIAVSVSTDGGSTFTEFGSVSDIDIAAGIGESQVSVHKVWNIVKTTDEDITVNGSLVMKLTIQKGTTNKGCFFGLSNVILSAEGDTWYIEEIPDADKTKIYHATKTNSSGLGSLMLGYTAAIPTGINAFYPTATNDLMDYHITFESYNTLLPAETPAILKIADNGDAAATYKFYYNGSEVPDAANKSTGSDGLIIDGSLYKKPVYVEGYKEAGGALDGQEDCYAYMYVNNAPQNQYLYWVYENYYVNDDGSWYTHEENSDDGKHINVNPNRAFLIVGHSKVPYNASTNTAAVPTAFALRFNESSFTGIDEIPSGYRTAPASDSAKGTFDLQGRKLDAITAPGYYIIDGKKVFVK